MLTRKNCLNRTLIILSSIFLLCPFAAQYAMLSGYGEQCDNFTECKDHRMICSGGENNMTCICSRHHEWKGLEFGCVQMYDGLKMMKLELYFNNITEVIAKAEESVFKLQLWSGGFVVVVGILAIAIVMIFCCYIRSKDSKVKTDLHHLELNVRRNTQARRQTTIASTV